MEDPLAMLRCGANYSTAYEALPTSPLVQEEEQEENENFAISNTTRYTLAGIYLACSLLAAAVIAIFVDPLSRYLAHLPLWCFDFLKELFLCHIVGFFSSFFLSVRLSVFTFVSLFFSSDCRFPYLSILCSYRQIYRV